MKPSLIALFALCLSACMPLPVESTIDACPSTGLVNVIFTEGRPPGGEPFPFEPAEKENARLWHLSSGKDVYLTCQYDDGSTRLQKMSTGVNSCTFTTTGRLTCRSFI